MNPVPPSMNTCLSCSTPLAEKLHKRQYCLECLTAFSKIKARCTSCAQPLHESTLRCDSCGQRHGMQSCSFCGEPLFKHAAAQISSKVWRQLPSGGTLLSRILNWMRSPRDRQLYYVHPYCVEPSLPYWNGSVSVIEADPSLLTEPLTLDQFNGDLLNGDLSRVVLQGQASSVQEASVNSSMNSLRNHSDSDLSLLDAATAEDWEQVLLPDFYHQYLEGERLFSGLDIPGITLEKLDLQNIDLSQANLQRSTWFKVNLAGANLSEAIADYSKFDSSDFKAVRFRSSSIRDAKVILSDLYQADFYQADLRRTDFYSSNFYRATLTLANLKDAKLDAANLSYACLLHANLTRASFMEAVMEFANLEQADCSSSNLSWAILQNAIASHANFREAILQNTDLTGIDLSGALLEGADFLGSNLADAKSLHQAQYNDQTRFPEGFDPVQHGLIKV